MLFVTWLILLNSFGVKLKLKNFGIMLGTDIEGSIANCVVFGEGERAIIQGEFLSIYVWFKIDLFLL